MAGKNWQSETKVWSDINWRGFLLEIYASVNR